MKKENVFFLVDVAVYLIKGLSSLFKKKEKKK